MSDLLYTKISLLGVVIASLLLSYYDMIDLFLSLIRLLNDVSDLLLWIRVRGLGVNITNYHLCVAFHLLFPLWRIRVK